ncbi:MAG: sensor histidine kinase [Burkholderiales bacterium PBB5]|nr:MAG: sensor histidine kinase [Burkholderiales bacterium PBB5]
MAALSPAPSTALPGTVPVSPFAVFTWRELLRHGLRVAVVCVAVGLMLGYLRGEGYAHTLAYSLCIGTASWLCIDLGRFALQPSPHSGWPAGWRGPMLCVVGCALGFAIGTAAADLLNGHPVYSGYRLGLRRLSNDLAVSAAIGALLSGYYYLRGKDAYHQAMAAQAERDLALARLAMLQTQLEPHMLFNTLANLRVLISLDAVRAQAMLDRLIAYLRATLSASRQPLHPLSAEFERLADYLALMAVRMGARLQVDIQLPEALRATPVPPMLLQPLVENAIQHGLEPQVAGGCITLRADTLGGQLRLTVHDTGAGLPPGAVLDTTASTTTSTPAGTPTSATAAPASHRLPGADSAHDGRGYGTRHVAERLATLYGPGAGLRLQPAPGGGTLAEVLMPLNTTPY